MPLLKALSFAGKFPQLNYKVEEMERLMDHPPLKQTDRPFEGQGHDIRFENVHFSYKDAEVIHGIDLTIKEGQMAALVGESGSGKSTLAEWPQAEWPLYFNLKYRTQSYSKIPCNASEMFMRFP